jgi:hypothetical protein
MFDIFEDKRPPSLYIADVIVEVLIPTRSRKTKTFDRTLINLEKIPIVLLDGSFPTQRIADSFFSRIHNNYIKRGEIQNIKFKILSIKNLKFSSKLAYKFDFDTH